ncbi:MAG: hypothetical protein PHX04_04795 [Bacilli bacterium]|nr:hypothetical protein [Bacilli bacterium]
MKTQLISGVQNIIAIDLAKKETFQQKREENLRNKKQTISDESVMPQDTVEISPAGMNAYNELQNQKNINANSLTNAELLSQNFENKTQDNAVYLEIINEVAKAMDILDSVSAKVVKLMPTSELEKEPIQQDIATEVVNNNQLGQETINQEIQPFASNQNIFDSMQGPNL